MAASFFWQYCPIIVCGFLSGRESCPPFKVKTEEYGKKNGKTPKGGASITEKWQRDSNYRHQPHSHSNIYEEVHEEAACHAIAVNAVETVLLTFAENY